MSAQTLLIVSLALLFGVDTVPAQRPALPKWKQRRSALERKHQVDEFRIYYSLQGHDALPDARDRNDNSVPDRIENIALQLTTARDLYTEVLKLRHPLESPRYKGKAKFIDVHVGTLPFSPGGNAGNGSAGDAVVNYFRPSDSEEGVDVLTIDIRGTLATDNLTPAHELFHLFQNGYSMFKASWYTEGTARWAEFTLREGAGKPTGVPQTREQLDQLFGKKYAAVGFWLSLAHAADPAGELPIPQRLRDVHYIGSDKPVIADTNFHGAALLKHLLEALAAADDRATDELNLKPFAWKEAQQRSPETYPYIWSAVLEVAQDCSERSEEIRRMVEGLRP